MNRKIRLLTVIALAIAGISVMAYPAFSSYLNALHSSRALQNLSARLDAADSDTLREQRELAKAYNRGAAPEQYEELLDFGNGIMGSIRIPEIGVELPIYHGVSDTVLQKGAGHLPTSSLPIGGTGNHCVLTGHTGLPSAELFTGLTELTAGDLFYLHILNEILAYEVDQILVVLPHEVEALRPVPGRDYCTLVTCTPYGINTHRLLVRGQRISVEEEAVLLPPSEAADKGMPLPPELILAGSGIFLLLITGTLLLLRKNGEECP
ncbi:MAG: class C sortase [Oscillospiraceae bacterium]|nr:class C sortase [Oscillospiraceae bacterium]